TIRMLFIAYAKLIKSFLTSYVNSKSMVSNQALFLPLHSLPLHSLLLPYPFFLEQVLGSLLPTAPIAVLAEATRKRKNSISLIPA
ncbi:MAG: hypothetical protein AVDCRST_MAG56-2977, partial [uncultured Cytophagales bacterium]